MSHLKHTERTNSTNRSNSSSLSKRIKSIRLQKTKFVSKLHSWKTTAKLMQANIKIILTEKYFLMGYLPSTSRSKDIGKHVNVSIDTMQQNIINNSVNLHQTSTITKTSMLILSWCRSKKKITFLKRWKKSVREKNKNKLRHRRRNPRLEAPNMKVQIANSSLREIAQASAGKPHNNLKVLIIMKIRKRRPKSTLK